MVQNHAFYIIPESEVVYYTPEHSVTQTYRLHPNRGYTETVSFPLSILRQNFPQGRNTQSTCSETHTKTEQLHVYMFYFLSIGAISRIPIIPGIRGIF